MPKKCERQQPTIRLSIHTPASAVHRHIDKVIQIKEPSDWQVWAHSMGKALEAMGYVNDRFVLGFYLDLINNLPRDHRLALLRGIVEGRGLNIKTIFNEETGAPEGIEVDLPQRYDPLAGPKLTESGIVLPDHPGSSDLVLPGDSDYNG